MSGDVQPRKRKDKKKKKDDLGVEEPRGTAAALGEGDVFMHSYHDHGTGGHWCAKIIFFSLLAVLVTLIGLIILENRGLTELEANSVESRYSGVLEGWIEDAVDDHHDEHTLELKHHDDDENHPDDQVDENEAEEESLEEEIDHDDDGDESDEDEGVSHEIDDDEEDETLHDDDEEDETQHDDDEEYETQHDDDEEDETQHDDDDEEDEMQNDEEDDDERQDEEIENDDDEEGETQNDDDEDGETQNDDDEGYDEDNDDHENLKDADHEDDEEEIYERYTYEEISKTNNIVVDDDDEQKDNYLSKEVSHNYRGSEEHKTEDEEDDQGDDDDEEEEIEKIEKEIIDDDDDDDDSEEITDKDKREASKEDVKDTSNEDDGDEPPVERISRPRDGKPFIEIEEETPVKPVDTLADEEAYERQQEELRRQEEETPQSLWLKLCVGGALLAATHALVRRAARSDPPETEETVREETPSLTDRRMTIIDEQISVTQTPPSQAPRQIVDEEVFKRPAPVVQSAPIAKPKLEEEIVKEVVAKVLEIPKTDSKKEEEKELYSEEEEEDEEEDVEEDSEVPQKTPPKQQEEESEPEPEEVSDVEIIYDETVEEEEIPEEDIEEEEISDVDDTELLSRLEAKYGRLPEPERPGQYKGGGNSLEAEWAGEPSDPYWRSQLDTAEEEFRQGAWGAAAGRAGGEGLRRSTRARWLRARSLDRAAEQKRDNRVLSEAIAAYLHLLEMNDALSDERLLEVARRTIDRIQFRGTYLSAEPVYRLLIRRFPDDVNYRNNLTISFLMANRADLADEVLRETLRLWPNDRVALAHHGFVLKTHYNKLEEAVDALRRALEGDAGRANEPRFYYHLGDALLMLGRFDEAHEVHKRGAKLGHFLSPAQRSLYNVPRLRSRPWWRVEDTPYIELARALEGSWRDILKEGEVAVALYEQEKEGLRERGEWSQLDIFVRGREVGGRCASAPAVCAAVRGAGAGCRRGQVKFSMMAAGTHVRPHVGPTNCRLRMHLALSNTEGTYLRVDKEIRQWQVGKTLLFDDSFEHEVWHNGTGTRLVLIVDVWHPDLTAAERRQLPAI